MLDRVRAVALLREFQAVAEEVGIAGPVPLAVLANAPDLYLPVHDRDPAVTRASLEAALGHAIEALDRMRVREGAVLRDDFLRRVAHVAALCRDVEARAEAMTDHYRRRLRERLARLVEGVQVDTARIEQEVALLADHSDVTEELTRLACHRAALEGLLVADETVGRRLDFVLQEMAREANTLGAKATEVEVNAAVLALKSEIERMREQAQNIE
jgi:uncharacterized protein (TIGR00255 family)